jgi:hypothetical protein
MEESDLKLWCCGKEMEFDPGLWETDGIVEYDCRVCNRSVRVTDDKKGGSNG